MNNAVKQGSIPENLNTNNQNYSVNRLRNKKKYTVKRLNRQNYTRLVGEIYK